jgi:hypothetical protein
MKVLPTTRAAQLATPQRDEETWLIEGLWSAQAVGIIGGNEKEPVMRRNPLSPLSSLINGPCELLINRTRPSHGVQPRQELRIPFPSRGFSGSR